MKASCTERRAFVFTKEIPFGVVILLLSLLLRDHIQSEKLGQAAQMLVYSNAKEPERALETILQKNPHHEVKGKATFSLGLVNRSHDKNADAEKLFEQVIEKFGDIQNYRGTLADAARGQS